MKLSRRDFLKSAAAAATIMAAGCTPRGKRRDEVQTVQDIEEVDRWEKGVCRFCGTGCGAMVGVKDGKVVAVKGSEDNPVNEGLFCVKGSLLPAYLYGEDRLTKPLIRRDGELQEAEWDEAMDLIANKFEEIIDEHGADALGFYGSGQCNASEAYAYNKLYKGAIGTNNVEGNPRTCMASAVGGYVTTFGKDEPMGIYADFEEADVFFIIGSNTAEAHPVLFNRIVKHKRENPDVKVIVADPRLTRTGEIADYYLTFKPGNDLALMNSMAYVIINEGLTDEQFIEDHTNFNSDGEDMSYEEFKEFIADYAPEDVADLVGIEAEEIYEVARLFADPDKETTSLWCMGINQRVRGVWANNLIHNLHLLTGKICRPGSTPFSLTGQPSACGSIREVGALSHLLPAHRVVDNEQHRQEIAEIWGIDPDRIQPEPGLHTISLFDATYTGDIKALFVMCTNPGHTLPNLQRYREGMERTFLIVSDIYPNRTTELADVVLPAATWVEKEGIYGNAERRTQHIAKAIDPPGEAKPDLEIVVDLAHRLGYQDLFPYEGPADVWAEYRQTTLGTGMDLAPYERYKQEHGLLWPVVDGQETKRRFVADYDPYVEEGVDFYGHPDGRAIIFARPHTPPEEPPTEEYPYTLTTGRVVEHWHTSTMTGRIPQLKRAFPEHYVEVNPEDAEKLGVNEGDMLKIISRRGEITLPTKIKGRAEPRPGLLFVPMHDEEKLINFVTIDAYDPGSKQPEYKLCAVRVEKA
ncbi:molybdopterin-dependent oxidoreductase [Fuchsiella alkaliacetigena]|uniref:molybdopterin-dependent oxidoreductase n=1 Tax=Fuchsiella alkaliacetigena TaxID=957042 RepID=UPI00200B1C02|nr:molybdopterin-dependent oxidoreductase [Fuchsiella alkaliacetigena]MCK8824806.1 molybdopterin-dependent oxidoreductase [Fuchsiella alkaliacetigena]